MGAFKKSALWDVVLGARRTEAEIVHMRTAMLRAPRKNAMRPESDF